MKSTYLISIAVASTTLLASCGGGGSQKQSSTQDDKTLLGAGSTFVYPLYSKIFNVYHQQTGIQVNYQSIGSGGGILQLINKTVDFGDSDAPLTADQEKQAGAPIVHIPICAGAVVLTYNLPGISDTLMLTPDVLANIYLGKITRWNDPAVQSINPKIKLPSLPIAVVHRSDGSGTTNIFTDYLSKVSPEWKTRVGASTSVNWPVGLGGKGNEGVSGLIKQTPGGFGYVELAYAIQNQMPVVKVQNAAGQFIAPTIASTQAASNISLPADAKVFVTNTTAPNGYPISGFTWAILYREQHYGDRSLNRAKELVNLFWWVTHDGQAYCADLHYAPLSATAQATAENLLKSITFDGKPIFTSTTQ
ncbi:MAG: phosphate ABC transporter substrate-binding protein PstS [Thermoflavifilum sp.]|nr:phosphate ABC transporter substrate-binding protein PstS [Thermoflavifilum sp.]